MSKQQVEVKIVRFGPVSDDSSYTEESYRDAVIDTVSDEIAKLGYNGELVVVTDIDFRNFISTDDISQTVAIATQGLSREEFDSVGAVTGINMALGRINKV